MTNKQAFDMISNLVSQLKLTLDEHKQVQQALAILKPKDEPKAE